MLGAGVKAGIHGTAPNLDLDHNEDLTYSTDFRSVYATVLDRWLHCDAKAVLGTNHQVLDFVRRGAS